jgi:hypothetical protein
VFDLTLRKRLVSWKFISQLVWGCDHEKNKREKPEKYDAEPPLMTPKGKPELLDLYGRFYDYRNDINHAGVRKSLSDPKNIN